MLILDELVTTAASAEDARWHDWVETEPMLQGLVPIHIVRVAQLLYVNICMHCHVECSAEIGLGEAFDTSLARIGKR